MNMLAMSRSFLPIGLLVAFFESSQAQGSADFMVPFARNDITNVWASIPPFIGATSSPQPGDAVRVLK